MAPIKSAFTPAAIDELAKCSLPETLTPGLAVEVLASGKKRWRFRRGIAGMKVCGKHVIATLFGGLFPAMSITEALEWARALNALVEKSVDPRVVQCRNAMTVAKAHEFYMAAVREGRSSRAKKANKPRSIKDKMAIYLRDIAPRLAAISIYEVTEKDLIRLVEPRAGPPRYLQTVWLPSRRPAHKPSRYRRSCLRIMRKRSRRGSASFCASKELFLKGPEPWQGLPKPSE